MLERTEQRFGPKPKLLAADTAYGSAPMLQCCFQEPSRATSSGQLVAHVRKEIGPIASPDLMQFAPELPKTRSGKIMRRVLRKIAEDDFANLGDTSTLADPAVIDDLIGNRQNRTK